MDEKTDSIKEQPRYKYKDEYCELVKNHLSQGKSIESFGGKIGVVRATIYEWKKHIPEFAEAIEIGTANGLDKLETLLFAKADGREITIGDKKFNPKNSDLGAIIFPLKTRFHKIYGDKTKHEVETGNGVSISLAYTPKESDE